MDRDLSTDEIVRRWHSLREQGRDASIEDLCVDRPELATDVKERLKAVASMMSFMGLDRDHPSSPMGGSTRDWLEGRNDPDLTVSHPGPGSTEHDFDDPAPHAHRPPRADGQRFRVLHFHARGGRGAVFVALDGELNREVALKQILESHADDAASRHRFVLEAEITGGLEHPGIVPVYGLGKYDDGRPYYAMRFIRGDSLKDAIARFHGDAGHDPDPGRRSLELRKLLRRFTDVCNAIEYAHARGVLHRDLKPANVIVGDYGETLVVDWGLAKATGKADPAAVERSLRPNSVGGVASTMPGSTLGTPAFMSPEQARGDLEALGSRSDVYSLGATLYCVLSGRPAFEGHDLIAVLKDVEQGRFPSPRQLDPTIDPALEAICLKAMALSPEDRYASARALADDLDGWMADEPVTAYREPFARRARRWARRHRTAVTAAVAALLVAAIGLGIISAVQTKARNDLAAKNKALDEQKLRAEDREALAIDAVKRFRDAIANEPELKKTPALEDLRKRLMKEPLDFFRKLRDRLQADHDTRPDSLARLADAGFNLGMLANEIGDKQDALIALREAIAIYEKLADARPTVDRFRRDLAVSLDNIGIMLRTTGTLAEALKSHESALAIRRKLAGDNPTDARFQSDLAASYNNIGNLRNVTGQPAEALKAHKSAVAIYEKLVDANPAVTEFQRSLAASYYNIGNLLGDTGRPVDALQACESALAIRRKLVDTNPSDARFQGDLAASHNSIGVLLGDTGKTAEALKAHESALAIRRKLVDANPTVTGFQSDLSVSHNNIGLLLRATGKLAEALKAHESALAIRRKLVDANPTDTQFQSDLAASHNDIGNLLIATGKPAEALKSCESALAIYEKLVDANPAVTRFRSGLAVSHNDIGNLLIATGKPAEALKAYASALAIRRELADANPGVTEFQRSLAASHYNIGLLLSATGKTAEAREAHESALAIRRTLAREHPESPDFASRLGWALNVLAMIDLDAKRFEEARVRLRDAIEWQRKALASNPADPTYRQFLAKHWMNLILAARGLDDSEGVAEAERELAELRDSDPAMVALDARLSAIFRGDQQPRDNLERLRLGQRAYDKAFHAAAAKLWADALDADPKLAEDRQVQTRYNAACAAALAGCGQGKDVPAPDDSARARLREQARGWLQAELAAWTRLVESGPAAARPFIVQTLKHWREDADLAGIRDEGALARFPEKEREGFQVLWKDVEALQKKAAGDKPE